MSLDNAPLGHDVTYPGVYDPTLLFPIDRAENRATLGLSAAATGLPFIGGDIWNAYELSWLNPRGKPALAIAVFQVPANTPRIIESKSFKLYLNSYNQTRIAGPAQLRTQLATDLAAAAGGPVGVELIFPESFDALSLGELREAWNRATGHEPDRTQARQTAAEQIAGSVAAFAAAGRQATGEITEDDPLPALRSAVAGGDVREIVVVTYPHAVEDTFHTDWASRARDELHVPVLHLYSGTSRLG